MGGEGRAGLDKLDTDDDRGEDGGALRRLSRAPTAASSGADIEQENIIGYSSMHYVSW